MSSILVAGHYIVLTFFLYAMSLYIVLTTCVLWREKSSEANNIDRFELLLQLTKQPLNCACLSMRMRLMY